MKVIISGGGTGGHIFPAVAIANEIRSRKPQADILFVGAEGKMEMEKVPKAGYEIIGLPMAGFNRASLLSNIGLPIKLLKSFWKARKLIKTFQPNITIGVGGFASGPTLAMANFVNSPTLIQEQNSYAGVTNKFLAKKARKICVAYPNMEQFFPKDKIILTGNPVRSDISKSDKSIEDSRIKFHLSPTKTTLLIIGGSLGARSINNAVKNNLENLSTLDLQIIWQTGKEYVTTAKSEIERLNLSNIHAADFIYDMADAYKAADFVISRAGALAVSELSLLAKPAVLVPYPFAAEDHQTSNAKALSDQNAAILIADYQIEEKLLETVTMLCKDSNLRSELSENISRFAKPNATSEIVDEIFKIVNL